jgi:hypothetical protein
MFHKGSPCGTLMSSPAVLSGPISMGAPMAQPMCIQQAPVCMPCDPCDPCGGTSVSTGYFGGYMPATSDCGCDAGSAGAVISSGSSLPAGGTYIPGPAGATP